MPLCWAHGTNARPAQNLGSGWVAVARRISLADSSHPVMKMSSSDAISLSLLEPCRSGKK